MQELWQQLVSQVLIPLAVAMALYIGVKAVNAFCKWADAYLEAHDLGVIEVLIQTAVIWVQKNYGNAPGKARMAQAVKWLAEHGYDVEQADIQRIYQALRKSGELPDKEATE